MSTHYTCDGPSCSHTFPPGEHRGTYPGIIGPGIRKFVFCCPSCHGSFEVRMINAGIEATGTTPKNPDAGR